MALPILEMPSWLTKKQQKVVLAIVIVVAGYYLLKWLQTANKRVVLDPSNSAEASALFDRLNPGLS